MCLIQVDRQEKGEMQERSAGQSVQPRDPSTGAGGKVLIAIWPGACEEPVTKLTTCPMLELDACISLMTLPLFSQSSILRGYQRSQEP